MARQRKRKIKIHLTERALSDIARIETYSVQEFGRKVTNRYLARIEAAIKRIAENSELMRPEPGFHLWLRFYRVEKHLMVCDCRDSGIIVILTVIHASMDIPSRLLELEPTLAAETELLHRQLN